MPGSSGLTQSMKKTIGHRGVETTTGETTYKKVKMGQGVVVSNSCNTASELSISILKLDCNGGSLCYPLPGLPPE